MTCRIIAGPIPLFGEGKVNGRIAAVEFEDGPHRGTHLLALHVGGVSGNTQSTEPDKGRDDCVISARATRLRLFRHGADLIGSWVYVNYPGGSASPCSSKSLLLCEVASLQEP